MPARDIFLSLMNLAWNVRVQIPLGLTLFFMLSDIRVQLEVNMNFLLGDEEQAAENDVFGNFNDVEVQTDDSESTNSSSQRSVLSSNLSPHSNTDISSLRNQAAGSSNGVEYSNFVNSAYQGSEWGALSSRQFGRRIALLRNQEAGSSVSASNTNDNHQVNEGEVSPSRQIMLPINEEAGSSVVKDINNASDSCQTDKDSSASQPTGRLFIRSRRSIVEAVTTRYCNRRPSSHNCHLGTDADKKATDENNLSPETATVDKVEVYVSAPDDEYMYPIFEFDDPEDDNTPV